MKQHEASIQSLRDVTLPQLMKWRSSLSETSFNCAAHVLGENIRVALGLHALSVNDMPGFGELMTQSHDSSAHLFNNSCRELDLLVSLSAKHSECLGARLSGGGFGGISVHLVRSQDAAAYAEQMADEYQEACGIRPQAFACAAADGASLM